MKTGLDELTQLKERIEEKKTLVARLEGKQAAALDELHKELGTRDPKKAKKEQHRLQSYIGKLEEEFAVSLKRFKREYPQLMEEN